MGPEDLVLDPFVSRDRIPRTPPSAPAKSSLLSTVYSDDAVLPSSSQTSMFQTDQNRPRYFIKLTDSPRSRSQGSLQRPSSLDVKSSKSERNASNNASPNLIQVVNRDNESPVPVDFNTPEMVAAKETARRGRIRGKKSNASTPSLIEKSSCSPSKTASLPLLKIDEIIGTPRSRDGRKSQLETTSITVGRGEVPNATVPSGTPHTSVFRRLRRSKRLQKSTQPSPPLSSRHDLQRATLSLNSSAPRHRCRRHQGNREDDTSPPSASSTAITTTTRGKRRGRCPESVIPPPRLTETSSVIPGCLGSSGCRRSQRNVARVNYAGL
ncbi:hypothetical protein ECG_09337 [Echinococcus granulosus]|uniref:Uncharacterized protein n=1 Tax=Echinococcus granulosus TaxID=6210 RepID=A0A068WT54_ECHGR|nr:hypothetical protein ECG_09337 [Echinococcus granulosus]CDS23321.1 hypothetical protein EgrG_000083500 [Echinococcus granulosus]